jgi:hypothetical protein
MTLTGFTDPFGDAISKAPKEEFLSLLIRRFS